MAMGANIMVIRHRQAGVPHTIAAEMDRLESNVSILNAGDGQHEHPSQALLDLFTLYQLLSPQSPRQFLAGKKIAIVGDILHSRVARSNIYSLTAMGATVHLAAPPTLLPKGFQDFLRGADTDQFQCHWEIEPALKEADFIMTLRLQKERMTEHLLPSLREYHQRFGITRNRIALAHPNVKILHPGPVNRGVEISSDLMDDSELSLIAQQVTSGVAVRMALLYLIGTSH
jgi:aspartate carbamoyltransferase catalytic subunit